MTGPRTSGSPPAWPTSTTATSTASSPPTRRYPLTGVKKNEIDTALGYFENNAPRMRYHWFPPVRPVHRLRRRRIKLQTVIGQRLKQSGRHWTVTRADSIIALRCREASRTWEAVCNTSHTRTRTA